MRMMDGAHHRAGEGDLGQLEGDGAGMPVPPQSTHTSALVTRADWA